MITFLSSADIGRLRAATSAVEVVVMSKKPLRFLRSLLGLERWPVSRRGQANLSRGLAIFVGIGTDGDAS